MVVRGESNIHNPNPKIISYPQYAFNPCLSVSYTIVCLDVNSGLKGHIPVFILYM
jgi:hypothetical protein